ncbi:hypothetical protein [Amycolatopsis sp. RTGN1]|uniref:hypothetical protein n=1 Tax=Amycolatopsis ponsaeliensis TaxID=2992142 RepID=UPI00254E0274|nr:hypothetical protein [Amycolatopsis sp. RTGN1]
MVDNVTTELDADWIVWGIEARDPSRLTQPGIGARTEQALIEMCESAGCVYLGCVDDDSHDLTPEGTYYRWQVRIPQAEHRRRTENDVPFAVAALTDYLRSLLPDGVEDWFIRLDPDRTRRLAVSDAMREVYADLLRPVEDTLLGLRSDGAQQRAPLVNFWAADDDYLAGDYALWLAKDRTVGCAPRPWLVLNVGVVASAEWWTTPAGRDMTRFGHTPGSPVLLLPRPDSPVWKASITSGTSAAAGGVSARYEWQAGDGATLAERLGQELPALFPNLDASGGAGAFTFR